ncbi:ABC transporter substrate-binding protein [Bordetella genomosp. 1]|uniref:ABC transporter substrate-binding protein n=1 Tax=Bordetella genomosp. 1 TaxID=1395607 RepID=A0ABX4F475_9BORD|nr:ABC transporter substrate-binding protein [Bordetella genomosp. 1]MDQ8034694.1 ABC transporter substrate-binding protein [Bordetella sp.]OZI68513.1 ABC transporter substrate-binding protein [Bordetella genomosp. 1]
MNQVLQATRKPITRRSLLRAAAAAGLAAPLGMLGARVLAQGAPRSFKIAWSQTAVCQSPVSVALERGFFDKYNLKVERINFSGSTDQLLEAIATGHADGGIGMALRWLKPLEQGFDVKLAVGTHGGCMRLLTAADSPIKAVADLKGKRVAVTDQASPVKNFFAIRVAQLGIDPESVDWRQYPQDLFGEVLRKGEVDAIAGDDPLIYTLREDNRLREVATNIEGDYENRTCCVLGLRGDLVRKDPEAAAAISRAVVDAQRWTAGNPDETARIFAPYVPGKVPPERIAAILRSHSHGHASTGVALREEIVGYAKDLKVIKVLSPDLDIQKYASVVVPDVFG